MIVVLGALFLAPAPAAAEGDYGSSTNSNGDPVVYVGLPGAPIPPSTGTGTVTCILYAATDYDPADGTVVEPVTDPQPGAVYLVICRNGDGETVYFATITYDPGVTVIDAETLARQAATELPLPYPDPRLAPPLPRPQLVGVRSWLWIEPVQWQPVSATAAVLGLSATVTATPRRVVWDMGEGGSDTTTCLGPGVAFTPGAPDDCTYVYQRSSPAASYPMRVTIERDVTWTASNGDGGVLAGTFPRTTQLPVEVRQRQAVIDG